MVMKNIIKMLFCLLLSMQLYTAGAQRSSRHETAHTERRNSNNTPFRNERQGNLRDNDRNTLSRSIITRHADGRANALDNRRIISTNQQRNDVALLERNRNNTAMQPQQRVYRENNVSTERYVSRNVYTTYNNNYYRRYPHVFMAGPRYTVLPRSFVTINFGGFPYYYNSGLFYGLYGGYYEPLFPPPGITIRILPFGYRRIFIGADLFYYFNGIYYRNRDKNTYEVVDAPMGATVSSLPKGAKSVVLNGEKLYELNGTYYKEDRNYKGETVYTVVGKNGEVNNSPAPSDNVSNAPLNPGDYLSQLPDGSKVVTINGEKLYVTPDDTYLKEEVSGNAVQYKVVGK